MTVHYGPGVSRERERAVANRRAAGDIAAALAIAKDAPVSCVRPAELDHRATDWRATAATAPQRDGKPGPWVCGLCHPPLASFEVELRRDVDPEGCA